MAILETSLVTETVLNGIRRAGGMRNFILQTIPDKIIVDTEEKVLIVALFSLVLEHHGAILHLLKAGRLTAARLPSSDRLSKPPTGATGSTVAPLRKPSSKSV